MRTTELRKEALLCGLTENYAHLVDRLLDRKIKLPETSGNFYITVDGVPLCVVDLALTSASGSICNFESLHDSIGLRAKIKAAFPGAVVAVHAGACPGKSHTQKAA